MGDVISITASVEEDQGTVARSADRVEDEASKITWVALLVSGWQWPPKCRWKLILVIIFEA